MTHYVLAPDPYRFQGMLYAMDSIVCWLFRVVLSPVRLVAMLLWTLFLAGWNLKEDHVEPAIFCLLMVPVFTIFMVLGATFKATLNGESWIF